MKRRGTATSAILAGLAALVIARLGLAVAGRFRLRGDAGLAAVGRNPFIVLADATGNAVGGEFRLVADVRAGVAWLFLAHHALAICTAKAASSLVRGVEVSFWPAWKSLAASRSFVSFWSRAMASIPPAESHCLRLRLSRTAWAS